MNGGGGEAGREEKSSASCKSTIHGLLTGCTRFLTRSSYDKRHFFIYRYTS